MNIWASVQVKTNKQQRTDADGQALPVKSDHPREGQAGIVFAIHPDHPAELGIRFDTDNAVELIEKSDLVVL
jgi:hypothetical protein